MLLCPDRILPEQHVLRPRNIDQQQATSRSQHVIKLFKTVVFVITTVLNAKTPRYTKRKRKHNKEYITRIIKGIVDLEAIVRDVMFYEI